MSSWGDQPMFGGPKNNQSRIEVRWFMIGAGVIFCFIIVGEIIPIVETIMTFLIFGLIGTGFAIWICGRRIKQANEMWHALNDPLENLLEEDMEYPRDGRYTIE
jgi:hypothetical protein